MTDGPVPRQARLQPPLRTGFAMHNTNKNNEHAPRAAVDRDTVIICQQLVDNLPQPLFVAELSTHGHWHIVLTNPAWRLLMTPGSSAPESITTVDEVLAVRLDECHSKDSSFTFHAILDRHQLEITLTPVAVPDSTTARVLGYVVDATLRQERDAQLERLEFALDRVHEAIYLLDEQARIRYVNGEASRMLGYSKEELSHMAVPDIDPEWPAERFPDGWQEAKAKAHAALTIESTHRRKDGSTLPVELTLTHFVYGAQEYLMVLVRDITERKRAQGELQARAEEFRALVEHSPDVVMRYDRECRATYLNPAFFKLTGLAAEDVIDIAPPLKDSVLNEPQQFLATLQEVLQTGEAAELVFKHRSTAGDGWAHARFVPEFDARGEVATVLAIGHDITAFKTAELQLRTLVENLPDMLTRFAPDGRILYINPVVAPTFGVKPEEILGSLPIGVSTDGIPLVDLISEVGRTGKANSCEVLWQTIYGERYFSTRQVPEVDESGAVVSVLGLATDITDRRDAEQLLLRLNRELRALSECNQVLLRAADESCLLQDICQIISDIAGYRMAWVGYAEQDADMSIRPVAWAGENSGYVEQAKLSWSDSVEHGRGPAGIAIRSGTNYYVQDFSTDVHMEPWRAAAIQRGYRSGIALPLKDDREQVFGVLLIYSAEPNAITPSEIRLLEELANDLAFGIVTLRTREERRRAEGELLRINRFLLTLSRCNEILIHASDEQALLQQMCRIVIEVGEFAMAWIGYVDNGIVHKMAQFGAQADAYLGTATLMTGEENGEQCRPALRAAQTGEIQVIQDMTQAECSQWQARALDYGYRSAIALPLMAGANVIGTFNIYASDSGGFGTQEVTLLSEMANDIGYGIETLRVRHDHQQFVERLQASMESTIQALASAVELRDPYTAGHQRRVAQLSVAVSRSMGWTEEQTQVVYLAGVVHDIGKIAVPAEILSKPGRLSETEMMLVREHASAGYDILRPVDFPWPIAQIVLQHHERMDGSGYPQGLQGDAILPEARILAVCDVVEAMTTHRPYRPGLGFDVALQEIESGRGTAFDPEVVDACVRVIRDERFAF
jgi:PAS domain S-box-containing protein